MICFIQFHSFLHTLGELHNSLPHNLYKVIPKNADISYGSLYPNCFALNTILDFNFKNTKWTGHSIVYHHSWLLLLLLYLHRRPNIELWSSGKNISIAVIVIWLHKQFRGKRQWHLLIYAMITSGYIGNDITRFYFKRCCVLISWLVSTAC